MRTGVNLMALGLFSVAVFPLIVLAYALLARREEGQMLGRFGELYGAYRRRTPMFVPRLGQWGRLFERPAPVPHADE